jgi:hypothetical protein
VIERKGERREVVREKAPASREAAAGDMEVVAPREEHETSVPSILRVMCVEWNRSVWSIFEERMISDL